MRPWMRTALVLLVILALVTVFFALLYRPPRQGQIPALPRSYQDVTCARDGVVPDRIVVEQGTVVVLNVTAVGEEFVFALLGYGISRRVAAGETVSLPSFQATLEGTFTYTCTTPTGTSLETRGTFVVEPAP